MWERMPWINSKRGQDRKNLLLKIGSHRSTLFGIELFIIKNMDMLSFKQWHKLIAPAKSHLLHQGCQALTHSTQMLLRIDAIRDAHGYSGGYLILPYGPDN